MIFLECIMKGGSNNNFINIIMDILKDKGSVFYVSISWKLLSFDANGINVFQVYILLFSFIICEVSLSDTTKSIKRSKQDQRSHKHYFILILHVFFPQIKFFIRMIFWMICFATLLWKMIKISLISLKINK